MSSRTYKRRRKREVGANVDDGESPLVCVCGEKVLYTKLIRDGILAHLNPYNLSDLQKVLELRCFKGLLDDVDLKECFFKGAWGFEEEDFGTLTYVPKRVVDIAFRGAQTLKRFKQHIDDPSSTTLGLTEFRDACAAGLHEDIILAMARVVILSPTSVAGAAMNGHIHVLDALAGTEWRPRIDDTLCLSYAARGDQIKVIDYLLNAEVFGLDVNDVNRDGYSALHIAARYGKIDAVKHLVNLGADCARRSYFRGRTPLDEAERNGHENVAKFLLEHGASRGLPQ